MNKCFAVIARRFTAQVRQWYAMCVWNSERRSLLMSATDQLQLLGKLMDMAQLRLRVHAANLANLDTPGYHAKEVSFEDEFKTALEHGGVSSALRVEPKTYEPRNTEEQVDGNDVSEEKETILSAEDQNRYDTYVQMARGELRLLTTAVTPAPGG
jgi:flagellar basal-body rod protein FlgB